MTTNLTKYEKDLDELILNGWHLYRVFAWEIDKEEAEASLTAAKIEESKKVYPSFTEGYEEWYSEALSCIAQLLPVRLEDFKELYRSSRQRKEINAETYTISDRILGLEIRKNGKVITGAREAFPKFNKQFLIIQSLKKTFRSSLFNIESTLQADLFDNELDAARDLNKKGFIRAGGAIAGVVLESHLAEVAHAHEIKITKNNSTISDLNNLLKENGTIDIPQWRRIQHLGDLRNICDHKKDREPSKEDVEDLITGVEKIIKSVF